MARKTTSARWGGGLVRALVGFVPLLVMLLGWQILGNINPSPMLPQPSTWMEAFSTLGGEALLRAMGGTILVFVLGVTIATFVGALAGVIIGASPRIERALNPTLEFARAIPAPVIVPVMVLAWGSGLATSLFAVSFAASWPVLMNTIQAIQARPALYSDVARTLQLSRTREIISMVLPATVPGVLVGYRVAVPLALIVTILVEMMTARVGVGYLLLTAQRQYDSAQTFGLLVVAGILGYVLSLLALLLTRRALNRWPPEIR